MHFNLVLCCSLAVGLFAGLFVGSALLTVAEHVAGANTASADAPTSIDSAALEAAAAYAANQHDNQLIHLARLYVPAAAAGVTAARAAYTAALARVTPQGVFDAGAVGDGGGGAAGAFVAHALSIIMHSGLDRVLPCTPDPDLPPPPPARYLVAANLHNSAAVLPNAALQLLRVVLAVPPGQLAVAVLESGSADDTGRWLHLLALLLGPIGVPARISVNSTLVRAEGQERIEYLVSVRNALIAPFFPADGPPAACRSPGGGGGAVACFQPERMVMVNDVFWCAGDMVRLMQQRDADIACGVDVGKFGYIGGAVTEDPAALLAGGAPRRAKQRLRHQHRRLATAATDEPHYQWASLIHNDKPNFGIENVVFYDLWVTRDAQGRRFNWNRPWAGDRATARALALGLPLPAYCCWNGLAVLNAAPFAAGLRFRTHLDGECRASECSLLCDDFHRLGHSRVVLDPSVLVGYGYAHKWVMHSPRFNYTQVMGFKTTTWAEVAAAPALTWPRRGAPPPATRPVECCGKEPMHEGVDWGKCTMTDAMAPNYTARWLDACSASVAGRGAARYPVDKGGGGDGSGGGEKERWAPCPRS